MTNDLTPFGGADLPEQFVIPVFDDRLEYLIDQFVQPHPDLHLPRVTQKARDAAQSALDIMAWMLEPASPKTVTAWLWPVLGGVRNPRSETDFKRFLAALMIAASDMPGVVWTRSSQARAAGTWVFAPSPPDILNPLKEDVNPLLARVRALRQIVAMAVRDRA